MMDEQITKEENQNDSQASENFDEKWRSAKSALELSDRSLEKCRSIIYVCAVLLTVAYVIIGIAFWVNSSKEVYHSYSYSLGDYDTTETNSAYVILGFVFAIGGPIFTAIMYQIAMFFLWLAFDIKAIRTVLTTKQLSNSLLSFYK